LGGAAGDILMHTNTYIHTYIHAYIQIAGRNRSRKACAEPAASGDEDICTLILEYIHICTQTHMYTYILQGGVD
jgi:hypothetical protein